MPYGQIAVAALDDAHKIEIEEERVSPFHAKFDLLVTMSEREERLEGVIDYRSELFDPGTIEMIQSRFEEVLRIAVEQPDIRLCLLKEQLDLLEEQAARQLSAAKLDRSRRKSVTTVAM
jgi:non-ribosomal peptide synthetase component F